MNAGIWDFWAPRYDSLWVQRWSLGPTRAKILERLPRVEGCRILDMGCGTGQHVAALLAEGFDAHGSDTSAEMLARAEALLGSTERIHAWRLGDEPPDSVVHAAPYDGRQFGLGVLA